MTVIENDSPKAHYKGPFNKGQLLPLTFPYTDKAHVFMLIDGMPAIYNVDYEIITEVSEEHPVAYPNSAYIKRDMADVSAIVIFRETPLDQQADFPQNSKFRSERIEQALDKICMEQQEQEEKLSRCIVAPITLETFNGQLPEPAPDTVLKWNKEGKELENYDIIGAENAFKEEVRESFATLENEIDNTIQTFETEVNQKIQNINQDVQEFEAEVTQTIQDFESDVNQTIQYFEAEVNQKVQDIHQDVQDFEANINEVLDEVLTAADQLENLDNSVALARDSAEAAAASSNEAKYYSDLTETTATGAITEIENRENEAITAINATVETVMTEIESVQTVADNITVVTEVAENLDDILNKTVDVGDTITGEPGTDAKVVNVGSQYDPILEFTIPRGEVGDDGGMSAEFDAETQTLSFSAPRGVALYPEWGYIRGDLNNQTDLKSALDSIQSTGDYVTHTELNNKGYLTSYTETDPIYTKDKPTLALKSELPSLDGYVKNTDLTDYVKNTDYATTVKAGLIRTSPTYGLNVSGSTGVMYSVSVTLDQYDTISTAHFVSKGTLDNVLTQYSKTVSMTEADYNALETKDENTLYLIEE